MKELMYAKGARKLVEDNAGVSPNEKVLIVADYKMADIARRVANAANAVSAEVVLAFMEPREWDCQEPPAMIAAAMMEADVIFSPVSVSIAWSMALKNARDNGARSILMTGFNDAIFTSPALLHTDFREQAIICEKYAKWLTDTNSVELTSPLGTNLTFSTKGRKGNIVNSLPGPGETGSAPNIEVNVIPLEGTANGTVIIDACIPYIGIGILDQPIEFTVTAGFVRNIKGGIQADILLQDLERRKDPNCYNVAELGIGLNPHAKITGTMLEDEGVFNTIHMAIGMNFTIGGNTIAPIHYDCIMHNPSIRLDGKLVQQEKELFL